MRSLCPPPPPYYGTEGVSGCCVQINNELANCKQSWLTNYNLFHNFFYSFHWTSLLVQWEKDCLRL